MHCVLILEMVLLALTFKVKMNDWTVKKVLPSALHQYTFIRIVCNGEDSSSFDHCCSIVLSRGNKNSVF